MLEPPLQPLLTAPLNSVDSYVAVPARREEGPHVLVGFVPDYSLDRIEGVVAFSISLDYSCVRHSYNSRF